MELGSVWLRLGARVTVIEMLPKIATTLDGQVGRKLQRVLKRQGMSFKMQTKVTAASISSKSVRVELETKKGSDSLSCDRLLISVGRSPRTEGLGIEDLGIKTDPETGHLLVDESYRTSVSSIYAIGDLIAGPMLAHLSILRRRPRALYGRNRRLRQSNCSQKNRPNSGGAHHRATGGGHDRRMCAGR